MLYDAPANPAPGESLGELMFGSAEQQATDGTTKRTSNQFLWATISLLRRWNRMSPPLTDAQMHTKPKPNWTIKDILD